MHDTTDTTGRLCVSDTRCRAYNPATRQAADVTTSPLCDACLTAAERDVRNLVYDYVDLEQLQSPALSQALNMQPAGKAAPPMPLNGGAEALQAEIVHVATTWEDVIRDHARLSARDTTPRRPGRQLDDAIRVLLPRLRQLAGIEAADVYPTGCEDQPATLTGWEAVHHLQHLHQRARGMLGRTHRTRQVPGTCPTCHADLHQDDPRDYEDPTPIYCAKQCGWQLDRDHYEQWMTGYLLNPKRVEATA
ncbi:hypothetical protein [Micromonospora wenchangensis]|uniref:hypothetical protein n=1 Tax=Micromonospora wenchangensis TaxID=1185415 RepID=UPI003817663F